MKKWAYAFRSTEEVEKIKRNFSVSSLLAKALVSLCLLDPEEIAEFTSTEKTDYDPFIIPDMEAGLSRINKALDRGEKIAVYGDYDADGVTATAVLYTYLEGIGADVTYYIPNRLSEGYGLNKNAIDTLFSEGVTLIITVDNGISSSEEVEYAKGLGIDTVITDHHKVSGKLPPAAAVINPQREDCEVYKELAGVGVAFMLVAANEGDIETALEYYSDLVCVGTMADVMPMTGINRLFVKRGLESIKTGSNAGIAALLELQENLKEIDYNAVSYSIVPRINASGRMGDATEALRLLISEDYDDAKSRSVTVDAQNKKRQETETEILAEAKSIIEEDKLYEHRVIIVSKEGWHQGVLGIVAAKLSEIYEKPCIVCSSNCGEAVGSGRSFGDFSLFDALQSVSHLLIRFGGHKLAAGVTLKEENVPYLIKALDKADDEMQMPLLPVCDKVSISELSLTSIEELDYLKPYGTDNQQPVFVLSGVRLDEIYSIGDGKHSRFKLSSPEGTIYAVCFGRTKDSFGLFAGMKVDVALTAEVNIYQGKRLPSYKVRDIRPYNFDEEAYERSLEFSKKVRSGEDFTADEVKRFLPTRDELVQIYSLISKNGYSGKPEHLAFLLPMPYGKIYTAITAFSSLKLITVYKKGNNIVLKTNETREKVDIFSAPILKRLMKGGV